jgi:predicted O-methyltransferase YrrM
MNRQGHIRNSMRHYMMRALRISESSVADKSLPHTASPIHEVQKSGIAEEHSLISRIQARHSQPSIISSAEDDPGQPNDRLFDIASEAVRLCRIIRMNVFSTRQSQEARWFEIWPGEHYRLLAALVRMLQPKTIIEIGTATGMGTLSLSQENQSGTIHTFDIIPWRDFTGTWLTEEDFREKIIQHIADVSEPAVMNTHRHIFEDADLIFVDGPKDGIFEPRFLSALDNLQTKKELLVMFDDTRLPNFIPAWRHIARPKIDLTSFGHWSGTGLVDWNG